MVCAVLDRNEHIEDSQPFEDPEVHSKCGGYYGSTENLARTPILFLLVSRLHAISYVYSRTLLCRVVG